MISWIIMYILSYKVPPSDSRPMRWLDDVWRNFRTFLLNARALMTWGPNWVSYTMPQRFINDFQVVLDPQNAREKCCSLFGDSLIYISMYLRSWTHSSIEITFGMIFYCTHPSIKGSPRLQQSKRLPRRSVAQFCDKMMILLTWEPNWVLGAMP